LISLKHWAADMHARRISFLTGSSEASCTAEMQPGQSLLDTVLFMQKQGVVDSLEQAKYLKDLRNDLVHEYIFDDKY